MWRMNRFRSLFNVRRQNNVQLLCLGFSLSILTTSDVAPTQATNNQIFWENEEKVQGLQKPDSNLKDSLAPTIPTG